MTTTSRWMGHRSTTCATDLPWAAPIWLRAGSENGDVAVLARPADPGLSLVVYGAEPGSASQDGLRLLASWAATLDQFEQPEAAEAPDQA